MFTFPILPSSPSSPSSPCSLFPVPCSRSAIKIYDSNPNAVVPIDRLKYQPGGSEVPHAEFKSVMADRLLQQDQWIIDGFGALDTVSKP